MKNQSQSREWIARLLIAIVLGMNLACAIDFIARPKLYLSAYELSGEVGRIVIIGYGIPLLMWQVPYFFALYHPRVQGFIDSGHFYADNWFYRRELAISDHTDENSVLRGSILRFIWFDGGGLIFLVIAYMVVSRTYLKKSE